VIQRDYIDRLIEQCAEALRRMLRLGREGNADAALVVFEEAADTMLGPIRPVVERMHADSAVAFVGPAQHERLRLYAALLGQQGLVHRWRGDSARAYLCCRRTLELYAALSAAGVVMSEDDRERIAVLTGVVDTRELDPHHAEALKLLRQS
jgi:hypothetical protein